jgi:DNA-binding PadR family transcriptional regulator
MVLQDRDLEILKFINKFGYVGLDHIREFYNFSQSRVYQILGRLVKNDYIDKKRVIADQASIYWLKTKGVNLLNTNRINKVSLQNIEHNLIVLNVYLELMKQDPNLEIKSDRELRQGKGFGYTGHIPDLEIQTEEQSGRKNIAIEIEISRKDRKRLKSIVSTMEHGSKYLQVHYYCLGSSIKLVREVTEFKPMFKVFEYMGLKYEKFQEVVKGVCEVAEQVKVDNGKKVKDLEIKANRLESNLKAKDKEIELLKKNLERIKNTFKNTEFKNISLFGSFAIKNKDLELLKRVMDIN